MLATKVKTAAVALSLALLGTGGGMFGYRAFAPEGAAAAEEGQKVPGVPKPTAGEEALRKQLDVTRQQLDAIRDRLEKQEKRIKAQAEQLRLYKNRQAEQLRLYKNRSAIIAGDPAPSIDDLRDALEILQFKVAVKKAHLEAAKVDLSDAKKILETITIINATRRALPEDNFKEARSMIATAEAQACVWEAELKESALRVQQVERRLKKKSVPKAPEPNSTPPKRDDGLNSIETWA